MEAFQGRLATKSLPEPAEIISPAYNPEHKL